MQYRHYLTQYFLLDGTIFIGPANRAGNYIITLRAHDLHQLFANSGIVPLTTFSSSAEALQAVLDVLLLHGLATHYQQHIEWLSADEQWRLSRKDDGWQIRPHMPYTQWWRLQRCLLSAPEQVFATRDIAVAVAELSVTNIVSTIDSKNG